MQSLVYESTQVVLQRIDQFQPILLFSAIRFWYIIRGCFHCLRTATLTLFLIHPPTVWFGLTNVNVSGFATALFLQVISFTLSFRRCFLFSSTLSIQPLLRFQNPNPNRHRISFPASPRYFHLRFAVPYAWRQR